MNIYLIEYKDKECDINQDINIEEIWESIFNSPNYKALSQDGIPIEF